MLESDFDREIKKLKPQQILRTHHHYYFLTSPKKQEETIGRPRRNNFLWQETKKRTVRKVQRPLFINMLSLERVADGEVQAHAVLEAGNVVPAAAASVVRRVQADAHVETDDDEVEVVAQARARADSQLAEVLGVELTAGAVGVFAREPHVAGIEEHRAVEAAEEPRAQFDVGFKFHVARLVHIGVFAVGGTEVAWADAAHREGTHAVGTAHIELFGIGRAEGIAVRENHAAEGTGRKLDIAVDANGVVHLGCEFEELCEGVAEEFLVLPLKRFAESGVNARDKVAALLARYLHPRGVAVRGG